MTKAEVLVNWTPAEVGLVMEDVGRECPNCHTGRLEGFVAMGKAHHAEADCVETRGERKGKHFHTVYDCMSCAAFYEVVEC